jgi:signal transduction histidine kinase
MGSGASRLVVAMVEDLSETKTAQDESMPEPEGNLEKLAGRLIQAQEEERSRIARELHHYIDSLAVLGIKLSQFGQNPSEWIDDAMDEARQEVKDIVNDIHALSNLLHSAKLEYLGLGATAASFCKELSRLQNVEINFHCEGIPKELPKNIALCLYRVLQEALQNVTKYSGSRLCEVTLRRESSELQLTVRDWGVGFDPAAAMKGPGLGLLSMKERLKLFDGELFIESQPQQGTTVRARVPLTVH